MFENENQNQFPNTGNNSVNNDNLTGNNNYTGYTASNYNHGMENNYSYTNQYQVTQDTAQETNQNTMRNATTDTAQNYNQYSNMYGNSIYDRPVFGSETTYGGENVKTNEPKVKKQKSPALKKFLKLAGSGLVFGVFAGLIIMGMLYAMPDKTGMSLEKKETVIAETEETEPEEVQNKNQMLETYEVSQGSAAVVTDVSDVVEEVMPSVVSITGMYKVQNDYDDIWGSYFGFPQTEQEEPGSGSGIIVGKNDEELLLVTNNHVVEDATSLSVQFIDGTTVADAKIKGTDANVDLAVIAVPLENIPDETFGQIRIANLGDSDKLRVGEAAIAIGNALGYGQSVTTGVISALNREYTVDGTTNYLLQTDAAINPGNSGGALLNIRGEVIGINSNKIAGSAVEGMGYAIPISTAKPIIEELMTKETREKVEEEQKAFLGISGINVTEDVQMNYGLPEGVYIAQVYDNTAAQKAGLTKGDIIVEFDGEKIESFEELSSLLEYYSKGTTVEVVIMQGSPEGYQEKTITVTLGGRTDS